MRIRLLSVGISSDELNIALRARLTAVFGAYSELPCKINYFADFHSLLPVLSDSLEENELTVLFVSPSVCEEVKRSLLRALHLKCQLDSGILGRLSKALTAVEREMHAMFPENSRIFPTEDGRYSSFFCRVGENRLLFFPLYEDFIYTAEKRIFSALARIAPIPEKEEPYLWLFHSVAKALYDRNLTVAVAGTSTAKYIQAAAIHTGQMGKCFKFCEKEPVADEKQVPHDRAAAAAAQAAVACNTLLGISMSNIFVLKKNGAEQYVIYIAVSVNNRANISRVYARGEDIETFLKRASSELLSLLLCSVDGLNEASEDDGFDVF